MDLHTCWSGISFWQFEDPCWQQFSKQFIDIKLSKVVIRIWMWKGS